MGPLLIGSRAMRTRDVGSSSHLAPEASERPLLVRAEQVRAQFRVMPGAFIGSALVATVVVAMMYARINLNVLLSWLASVYALSLGRFALWRWFRHVNPGVLEMTRWRRLAIVAGGISGLIWGVGAILLHDPASLPHQLFVLLATTGIGFTSTYMTAPLMPVFLAYVVPSYVLSSLPFLLDRDRFHVLIGVVTLLVLPMIVHFARGVSRTFLDSVRVRLENLQLLGELREQKEAAEEANVAKSRFLAVASHDLRQPLHALGLFVQALQESPMAAGEPQLVGNIRRSVDAMEELFDALLDISRLDAGMVRPRIETFSLATVFERLTFEFGPLARQKGLALRAVRTSVYIRTDPTLFERIMRNLVSNAVRYTERGDVLIGCRREGANIRVEVWDTGRGIPANRHREVFREFSQLEAAGSADRKGLGLGLAIVERLSRLLGHEVRLRSHPGQGSVFSVTVPRGREADAIVNPAIEYTTAFDLAGVLILVIDAEPAVRQAMEALLTRWNGDVITAASGAEMKNKLSALDRVPSLIISDYRPSSTAAGLSPALTAIEMLRGEFNSEIPALLLTGDTGGEAAAGDQDVAGLPVLQKPLNPARLRTLIANLLRAEKTEEHPRRVSMRRVNQ